jgi:hypothetical protein
MRPTWAMKMTHAVKPSSVACYLSDVLYMDREKTDCAGSRALITSTWHWSLV